MSTPFWEARWLQGAAPKDLAPTLYEKASRGIHKINNHTTHTPQIRHSKRGDEEGEDGTLLLYAGADDLSTNLERDGSWRGRVRNELSELWADPPAFCRPGASPMKDLFHWEMVIDGPTGSPYEGGMFPLNVDLSNEYPARPPKITFQTEVFHPNINSEGEMVLDIFSGGEGTPALRMDKVLHSIVSVLYDPLLDFSVHGDIANLYKNDIKLYEELATVWTREYSSTPIVSHYPTEGELDHCEMIAAQAALEKAAEKESEKKAAEEESEKKAAENERKEEARLRRLKAEEERERRRKEEEKNETFLQWLWRMLLAFLFRDGP
ncbi:hypothetical protein PR202_gb09596 [Eleusine coracana subsp. coracana]|uniref:UBC core domain-containing protein n=1 Tax=Eleusine coracana subsp. coracana TaxID=191504 RepID=A0AAV5EI01_ELECO|nr:hypothetical protein PR202_gb09596 [Eleusine coracana subsp. coracana]